MGLQSRPFLCWLWPHWDGIGIPSYGSTRTEKQARWSPGFSRLPPEGGTPATSSKAPQRRGGYRYHQRPGAEMRARQAIRAVVAIHIRAAPLVQRLPRDQVVRRVPQHSPIAQDGAPHCALDFAGCQPAALVIRARLRERPTLDRLRLRRADERRHIPYRQSFTADRHCRTTVARQFTRDARTT